jgi:hypothetical protein
MIKRVTFDETGIYRNQDKNREKDREREHKKKRKRTITGKRFMRENRYTCHYRTEKHQ